MSSGVGKNLQERGRTPFLGNRTEFLVFAVSLLVAGVVWLVYNLSLQYQVFLDYPVNIVSDLPGYDSHTESDQQLIIRGKADGFYIIGRRLFNEKEPIELKAEGRYITPLDDSSDRFTIDTRFLRKELSSVLGSSVDIEYIVSDTLTFHLVPTATRKVPVRALCVIDCKPQYAVSAPVSLVPDSVLISGSGAAVSSVNEVWTEKISRSGVDGNIEGMAALSPVRNLDISVPGVMYSVEVKRYVEETLNVPVTMKNLPSGMKAVLLPDRTDVTYRRYFPLSGEIEARDFSVMIDYESFMASSSAYAIPVIEKSPHGVFSLVMKPELIECVILGR